MSAFSATRVVRFSQCDPAGIIFYPRYFEIIQEVTEDWFRDVLQLPYWNLIFELERGFPMRKLEVEFTAPSRLGDRLDVVLVVSHVGSTSIRIDFDVTCNGSARAIIQTVAVHTELKSGKAVRIEGPLRAAIVKSMEVSQ